MAAIKRDLEIRLTYSDVKAAKTALKTVEKRWKEAPGVRLWWGCQKEDKVYIRIRTSHGSPKKLTRQIRPWSISSKAIAYFERWR
jgi:hypothetical protein